MDAAHVPWLHFHHSGDQFTGQLQIDDAQAFAGEQLPPYAFIKNIAAEATAERTPLGVKQSIPYPGPDGRRYLAANEAILPNLIVIFGAIDAMYDVPVDDENFKVFAIFKEDFKGQKSAGVELHAGKTWWEMTEEEHRRFPGDYEAQGSIGRVPAHSREHLVQGDVGIVMLRRRLEEAVRDVAEGRDPPGVVFDEASLPMETAAHNMIPHDPA